MISLRAWAWVSGRSVRRFHLGFWVGPCGGGRVQAMRGGPWVASNIWVQAGSQGQSFGRCSRSLRAERASRAGTLMSWARMVPVVARAWNAEARQPVARVRLNAIAASTSQAELAWNNAEGKWASGPCFRSPWTCSMIAWARWVFSAWTKDQRTVGEHGVVTVETEQLLLTGIAGARFRLRVEAFDAAHDQAAFDVVGLASAGERRVVDLGDLRVADQALLVVVSADGSG